MCNASGTNKDVNGDKQRLEQIKYMSKKAKNKNDEQKKF